MSKKKKKTVSRKHRNFKQPLLIPKVNEASSEIEKYDPTVSEAPSVLNERNSNAEPTKVPAESNYIQALAKVGTVLGVLVPLGGIVWFSAVLRIDTTTTADDLKLHIQDTKDNFDLYNKMELKSFKIILTQELKTLKESQTITNNKIKSIEDKLTKIEITEKLKEKSNATTSN